MLVQKEVLIIHPSWILLFLLCYAIAFYVYFKTCNIFVSALSLASCMVGSAYIVHAYYGLI